MLGYLEIVLRVPVRVENDDRVGGGQVDAEAAGSRRQEEAKVLRSFGVEVFQRLASKLALDATVQSLEGKVAQLQVLADQVEHAHHLREDEHAVARFAQAHQQLVQQHQLSRAANQLLLGRKQNEQGRPSVNRFGSHSSSRTHLKVFRRAESRLALLRFGQKGVVAALLQLHDDVDKGGGRSFVALAQGRVVFGQDPLVILLLERRHVHAQDLLHFGRQRLLHVLFDAPQNVRLELFVQLGVALVRRVSVRLFERVPAFKPRRDQGQPSTSNLPKRLVLNFISCFTAQVFTFTI